MTDEHIGTGRKYQHLVEQARKFPNLKGDDKWNDFAILKHRAFVFAQSPCFSSWVSKHKSCVLKNPNTPRASARGFLTLRSDLYKGVREIATRVYDRESSIRMEDEVEDLVDIRYAYIMTFCEKIVDPNNYGFINNDPNLGRLIDQTGVLIRDKLDFVRVREMRESFREKMRKENANI